ncbi:Mrp/NBP35 family ATP-binding protein [Chondromyces apiculatus]|uniref:Iron-sulfur cluster carrier protein n=1 Tax=Chondromyces apiculatus DSM 436 TaxID=1192034 RepID=A0A017TB59_9BACT|nr:Mrp/NBP35 family ATP-binding protein [Chondromyces apiculatus]EYF05866.1 Cytosolic Fe-S cluster assembling factor NBP35 / Chromosome (plasmid) partitioning protein ParA [Chondromyces apiculatus DSM 436]
MAITVDAAVTALDKVIAPDLDRPLTETDRIRKLEVNEDVVSIQIEITSPFREPLASNVRAALEAAGAKEIKITWDLQVPPRVIQEDDPSPRVKNIVLVMSGKGGVGKSTVASNLTLALSRAGAKVGILDADMYGPSVPTMFGVMGRPTSADGQRFLPLERFGVKLMSIGFLIEDARSAVVWRGPMLQNALMQFMRDVDWGDLDYLILDLPPGTGDIALTISQKLRTTGAVIVTTPQEVALQDVYKSVSMAQKVGIPLLGVVENESYFVCDGCSKRHEIFGSGGGQRIAEFAEAPLLGQIPIVPAVREWGDAGTPIVQAAPESDVAKAFNQVAERLASQVSALGLSSAGGLRIDRSGGVNRRLPIMR